MQEKENREYIQEKKIKCHKAIICIIIIVTKITAANKEKINLDK